MSGAEGSPRVAVIIPTYDRAEMVVEAVRSALAQTERCRVVVVDDGSTDDTLDRLEPFGDEITVLEQENRERGAARNAGAEACGKAELLCFLDADDVLEAGHVAAVRRLARAHPEASLVTVRAVLADADLRPRGRLEHDRPGPVTLEDFLLSRSAVPPSGTAVRRNAFEAVGGFDERRKLSGSEDWLLVASLLARAPGFRGRERSVRIRKHGGNSMADAEAMERSMLLAHRIFFGEPAEGESRGARAAGRPVGLAAGRLPGRAPGRVGPDAGPEDSGSRELPAGIEARSRARLLVNAAAQHYGVGAMSRARAVLGDAAREDRSVVLEPKWGWIWLRSLLGSRLTRRLRELRGRS